MRKITIFISVSLLAVAAFAQDTTLTVTTEGRVGIGTTNPGNKLHVIGGAAFEGNHLYVRNLASPAGTQTWGIVISTSNGAFNLGQTTDTPPSGGTLTTIPFRIQANAPGGSLWIDSAGNIGIGISSSLAKLHVNGSAIKPGGGLWGTSSDRRLKKNIKPLENALHEMTRLRGVTYEWKEPDKFANQKGQQMGMIAQEVEQVFPKWVRTGMDGYKILEIKGFSALTVEAVRELKQENESLKKQLAETNERLEALEKIVSQIQSRQTGIALQ